MTDEKPTSMEVALEQIRGSISTGFTSVTGKLELLLQRADQSETRLNKHDEELAKVKEKQVALERNGVTKTGVYAFVGTVVAVVALGVAVVAVIVRAY